MRCPYCAEEVKDEAVVCKHCHSELFVVRPLLEKINDAFDLMHKGESIRSVVIY